MVTGTYPDSLTAVMRIILWRISRHIPPVPKIQTRRVMRSWFYLEHIRPSGSSLTNTIQWVSTYASASHLPRTLARLFITRRCFRKIRMHFKRRFCQVDAQHPLGLEIPLMLPIIWAGWMGFTTSLLLAFKNISILPVFHSRTPIEAVNILSNILNALGKVMEDDKNEDSFRSHLALQLRIFTMLRCSRQYSRCRRLPASFVLICIYRSPHIGRINWQIVRNFYKS